MDIIVTTAFGTEGVTARELRNLGYDMWVDGMGKTVTRLYMEYPEYMLDAKDLKAARRSFVEIKTSSMRREAKRAEVIITTGGMLDGGPVLQYIKALKDDPRNAILLVGYQADDTNGRFLLDTGMVKLHGEPTPIHCEVMKFDFSAHADHKQIVEFVRECDPTNVVIMHSDTREMFLEDLADYNVILPMEGEEFELEI